MRIVFIALLLVLGAGWMTWTQVPGEELAVVLRPTNTNESSYQGEVHPQYILWGKNGTTLFASEGKGGGGYGAEADLGSSFAFLDAGFPATPTFEGRVDVLEPDPFGRYERVDRLRLSSQEKFQEFYGKTPTRDPHRVLPWQVVKEVGGETYYLVSELEGETFLATKVSKSPIRSEILRVRMENGRIKVVQKLWQKKGAFSPAFSADAHHRLLFFGGVIPAFKVDGVGATVVYDALTGQPIDILREAASKAWHPHQNILAYIKWGSTTKEDESLQLKSYTLLGSTWSSHSLLN